MNVTDDVTEYGLLLVVVGRGGGSGSGGGGGGAGRMRLCQHATRSPTRPETKTMEGKKEDNDVLSASEQAKCRDEKGRKTSDKQNQMMSNNKSAVMLF
jgi:hypothetical protein